MYKLDNFKSCCDYLGIDNTLPVCQIDEREIQAAYKLRVCVKAWNRQDGFEPDEMAGYDQAEAGITPHFYLLDGKLLVADYAETCAVTGIIRAGEPYSDEYFNEFTFANFGLRLPLSSVKRAIEFGKTFIETFNELI